MIFGNDEYTYKQGNDGLWDVYEDGTFLVTCSTESAAREIVEILRKDAKRDD